MSRSLITFKSVNQLCSINLNFIRPAILVLLPMLAIIPIFVFFRVIDLDFLNSWHHLIHRRSSYRNDPFQVDGITLLIHSYILKNFQFHQLFIITGINTHYWVLNCRQLGDIVSFLHRIYSWCLLIFKFYLLALRCACPKDIEIILKIMGQTSLYLTLL